MNGKKVASSIFVLSLLGLAISIYSFLHNQGFAPGEFCTLSDTVNCDIVNKGPFSWIFGVPVSLIGVIGYLFSAIASGMKIRRPQDKSLSIFLLLSSIGGLLFSIYLSNLEAFVLHAWCVLCVTSQILILLIFFGAVTIIRTERAEHSATDPL